VVVVSVNNSKVTRHPPLGVRHQPQAACLVLQLQPREALVPLLQPSREALEVVSELPLQLPVACLELQPRHPLALVVAVVLEVARVDMARRHRLHKEACLEHQLPHPPALEPLHQLEEDSSEHLRRDPHPLAVVRPRRHNPDLEEPRVALEHQLPRRIQGLVVEVELSGNHSNNNNSSSHPPLAHQLQRVEAYLEHPHKHRRHLLVVEALVLLLAAALAVVQHPHKREECLEHPRLHLLAVDSLELPLRHRVNNNKVSRVREEEHEWPLTK
jgi:hypothetical protein